MKESVFIHRRQEDWQKLERHLVLKEHARFATSITLSDRVADDLSYAQAHYPDSALVPYLNELCVRAQLDIHSQPPPISREALSTWMKDVVQVMRRQRRPLLLSLSVFVVAISMGWLSSWIDPEFVRIILGDAYVDMTIANIEAGDPMAVYRDTDKAGMFLGIGVNNIRVAMLAFAMGMLTTVGPVMILFTNGVMVGAFFHMFYNKSLAALAWTTIMIHGTLELSAIVIAGGAGICIGNAILYPGSYSRRVSLQRAAMDAVHILLSLIPVFILAALLESYVTHQYQTLGMVGRVAIIVASLVLLYLYYFYSPTNNKMDAAV